MFFISQFSHSILIKFSHLLINSLTLLINYTEENLMVTCIVPKANQICDICDIWSNIGPKPRFFIEMVTYNSPIPQPQPHETFGPSYTSVHLNRHVLHTTYNETVLSCCWCIKSWYNIFRGYWHILRNHMSAARRLCHLSQCAQVCLCASFKISVEHKYHISCF